MAKLQRKTSRSAAELTVGLSEYALGFETLEIGVSALAGALGQDTSGSRLARVLALAPARVQVRVGFRIFGESSVMLDETGMRLDGVWFTTGGVVGPALQSVSSVALFAVTAGSGLDQWLLESQRDNGADLSPVIEKLGGIVVARAAAWTEQRIGEVSDLAGYDITNRYYPGSCGWPAKDRVSLFALLPPRFCGIFLNEQGAPLPARSAVGVIGIGRRAAKHPYPCESCTFTDCFRLNGWA